MSTTCCPLCRETKRMRRPKLLYNVPVCKKCLYRFANRRQFAYVIDAITFNVALFFGLIPLGMGLTYANVNSNSIDNVIMILAWVGFPLIFFLKDGFAGHSLGKLICGVQVVNRETLKPTGFWDSFKRNLVLIVPFMPLLIAILLPKGYRLGDGWAKTKVIWKRYANHPVFTGGLACENCQYDLTGNTTGICPECGTGFRLVNPPPLAWSSS